MTLVSLNMSYFLFFAVLGSFLPYFTLYLKEIGFAGRQIGILFAILPLVKSFGPILWGAVVDATGARKKVFVTAAIASAAVFTGYFYVTSFVWLAVLMAFYSLSRSALIPLIEATAWEYIDARGGEYGKIRVWGSIGFITSAFICGNLAQQFGIRSSLYLILFLSWVLAGISFFAPEQKKLSQTYRVADMVAFLKRPIILTFLLACILMRISHGAFTGFYSIRLQELGMSYSLIALMWPIAVGAEVILMLNYHRIFRNVAPARVMALSAAAAALRWILIASLTHPALIALTQLLHALTFAGFHIAAITYVNQTFPVEARTSGQGIFSALSFGVGGSIGLILSGFLYDALGSGMLFLIFSVIAAAACLVAWIQSNIKEPVPNP